MIVLDASAIVDSLLNAEDMERLLTFPDGEDWHAAPNFIDVEVLSGLRRLELGGHITATRAKEALSDFQQFNIMRFDVAELIPDIWRLRHNVSSYDAAYVVLAKVLDIRVVTRDRRLAGTAGHSAKITIL